MLRSRPRAIPLAFAILLALAPPIPLPAQAAAPPPDAVAHPLSASEADLVEKLLPAVVTISVRKPPEQPTTQASSQGPASDKDGGEWKPVFGSGFLIDPSGVIVTNRHVIEDARDIIIGLGDGRRAMGRVLATGGDVDLALIKIAADKPLPVMKLGDSDKVRVGDRVLVIGNPLGIGTSVSSGIVSALNRNIKDGPFDDFIQTDAALNHGNSGGPMINEAGDVIGVGTALYSNVPNGGSIGLGFAITANGTRFVVDRLMKYGRIKAGWIGAGFQDVTQAFVEALSLPSTSGSIIDTLEPGMPGAKAGLEVGDVILSMDGDVPDDSRALARAIARRDVGSTIHLAVWRNGRQLEIDPVLVEWPGDMRNDPPPPQTVHVEHGLQISAMTDALRKRYNLAADQDGVIVTGIAPEILTGERTLVPGDVILRVQNRPVATPAEVWQVLGEAKRENLPHVVMLVRGRDGQVWVPLLLKTM